MRRSNYPKPRRRPDRFKLCAAVILGLILCSFGRLLWLEKTFHTNKSSMQGFEDYVKSGQNELASNGPESPQSLQHRKDEYNNGDSNPSSMAGRNFVFIKLLKIGGSTLKSILIRHAREHGLVLGGRHAANASAPCNLFAQHATLPAYLRSPVVTPPAVFLALLRSPLDHMASFFYWNAQAFLADPPGNLSAAHRDALLAYARLNADADDGRRRRPAWPEHGPAPAPGPGALVYRQQWEWFAEEQDAAAGVAAAGRRLAELNFTFGFVEVRPGGPGLRVACRLPAACQTAPLPFSAPLSAP